MFSKEQLAYYKEYILLKNSANEVSRISPSLVSSKISLNPHQINAALSFFKNPKRKGMLFADEVGLGKTIEAGLVISQYWFEQKNKIIIICPASLIKQWNEELLDKFHLESVVLDGKTVKDSTFNWGKKIYITSINTVYLNKELFNTKFDLVVIDEAHKLRNVYKTKGLMAPAIKDLFSGQKKLLLTATPFQNNLKELYGLMSIIDEDIFPDFEVFQEQYIKNYYQNKETLGDVLNKYTVRTLRKDVSKYISFTKRNVILANYYLSDYEKKIYKAVEDLLYSSEVEDLYGTGQLHLIILLLQKLLSSSLYAVNSTLINIRNKLNNNETISFAFDEENEDLIFNDKEKKQFINSLDTCISIIEAAPADSKLNRLKDSIRDIYKEFDNDPNRNRKILIFTESKKTQEYLYNELRKEYDKIILFNGENTSTDINLIYNKWVQKHNNININKNIGVRKAIVDAFENDYEILIATDAAAEGLNLQFCSIVINYDLPWNPQKIEQRIGRCHRYGQKNDVIVVNLLNNSSNIDKRIYELLSSKLGIFEDTFGASDSILGLEISDDIEDAIKTVYKNCRSPKEIEQKFEELQLLFKEEIEQAIKAAEVNIDKYFDEEVVKAFDFQYIEAKRIVDEMADLFYRIIKSCLPNAVFLDDEYSFIVDGLKRTVLSKNDDNAEFCSISSDYGKKILDMISYPLHDRKRSITVDYSGSNKKIGFLDTLIEQNIKLIVSKISYYSFETVEKLVITGELDNGLIIPSDICHKLLKLECKEETEKDFVLSSKIKEVHKQSIDSSINDISDYNAAVFQEELNYINNWADSMIEKVQLDVKKMREERKELQMLCDLTNSVAEKARLQQQIQTISKKINKMWISLAEKEDQVDEKRDSLINSLISEKDKKIDIKKLFELEVHIK